MTNRLQELRVQNKEPQRVLADLLGLSIADYCKRELGYTRVTLEEAHKLAVHWGLSIEEIFFADVNSFNEIALCVDSS